MRLFQIEEPDGSPADSDMPGAAVGVDASGAAALVALAIGGNAAILADREGFEEALPVPPRTAAAEAWQTFFEGVRRRAERALSRPVTHAVVALAAMPGKAVAARLEATAGAAGLAVLRLAAVGELAAGAAPALAAAVLAEDLAPRS